MIQGAGDRCRKRTSSDWFVHVSGRSMRYPYLAHRNINMPTKKEEPKQPPVKQFQAPRGVHDVLPVDEAYWEKIEGAARELARSSGFSRLDPPILEFADLYNKTSGEESDIVEKEIYTLK